jgi:Fe(3+) dicitrate transport protein
MRRHLASLPVLLVTCATLAAAETPRASLDVTVLDPLGFVLPGAVVTVVEAGREARTDATGLARIADLAAGVYTLIVTAESLEPLRKPDVRVSAGGANHVAVAFRQVRSRHTQVDVVGEDVRLLRELPGSVDLLSRQELRASHTFDANDVLRRVPGLTVREDSGPAGMRLNIGIRGLNPDRSRQVLVLEDGLPLALAPYGEPEMYYSPPIERMQRVEIVKGSGSILFGPQTIGGVVNFVTPDPPSRPRASVDLTAGQRGLLIGQGSYGTTLDRVGLFVSGLRKQGAGFRQFEFEISDVTSKLTYDLGAARSLGLKVNFYDERSNSTYLGLTQPQFDQDPDQNVVPTDELRVRRLSGSLHHRRVLSDRALLTTTGFAYRTDRFWRRQDFDRAPNASRTYLRVAGDQSIPGGAVFLRSSAGSRDRAFQVAGLESRLMLEHRLFGLRHAFEGGGRFLYERAVDQHVNWSAPVGGTPAVRDSERRPARAFSAFAQNRLFLGGRVTLTPGVRVEQYRYTRHILRARVGGVPTDVDIRATDDLVEVVPGLGATLQVASSVTLFTGAHRGFAPPRVKDAISGAGESLELEAERSWNYEAGVRWAPRGGLRGEATVFVLDFSNQIIPAAQSGGATTTLVNAGHTLHRGVELSAGADLAVLARRESGFSADARYTWLPTAHFRSGIHDGHRLPYAPEHTLNLVLSYHARAGLNVQIDRTLIGRQFGDNAQTLQGSADGTIGLLPAYTLWHLAADYRMRRGRVELSPFVTLKNAANTLYIASRAPEGIQPGPFRQLNAGVRVGF